MKPEQGKAKCPKCGSASIHRLFYACVPLRVKCYTCNEEWPVDDIDDFAQFFTSPVTQTQEVKGSRTAKGIEALKEEADRELATCYPEVDRGQARYTKHKPGCNYWKTNECNCGSPSVSGEQAQPWSVCPRCIDGIYNGKECAVCWGTGRITETILQHEHQPPQPQPAPMGARDSQRIDEIKQRERKATKGGKLTSYEHGGGRLAIFADDNQVLIADFYLEPDREFYFNALSDILFLVAEVERLAHVSEKIAGLLPGTFYADRDLDFRIEKLVSGWNQAIAVNQSLEAAAEQKDREIADK